MKGRHLVSTLATWAALAACDPLAGGDYGGETRWSFPGTVSFPAGAGPPIRGMILLWQDVGSADGPGKIATRVPVELDFPVDFRIDLALAPPDASYFRFAAGEPRLAEGYLYALRTDDGPYALADVVGIDREHAIVYADADVVEGTLTAIYLGGPMTAGYHVRDWASSAELSPAQAELAARCPEPESCAAIRRYQLAPPIGAERLRLSVLPGGNVSAK